ncbi:hypothetical protein AXG93_3005s1090 [Marchantia polymorpha subsp. ruderalis]|uniref:Uncharacterized protein n=1 Tax=Marchantia polymorpha subsp. ruderalis TaxID=1480154 RepID=A0A176WN07_MARPO|nr:hypothetical protein AXG93_3005s1090 [Marchantia polymorpha subsp. ruderalis]
MDSESQSKQTRAEEARSNKTVPPPDAASPNLPHSDSWTDGAPSRIDPAVLTVHAEPVNGDTFIERGGYGGNQATPFLAIFSLIAGMVGIASAITGLHHVREGSSSSAAAAQATSWITWLLLILAFCLAWKEIHIGGRSVRHRVLEAFIIMLTATKLAETLAYYFGDKSRSRHDAAHGTPTTYDSTV